MKKEKKKSERITTIVIIVVVIAVLAMAVKIFYEMLTKESDSQEGETEIQKLLAKDLDQSYPATPREVVKIYCNIMKEMYSGECSEQDVQDLYAQMRKLYDEELLKENPYDKQYEELKEELESYKKDKKKIISIKLPDTDDVKRGNTDGEEMALVDVSIRMKEKSAWQQVDQEFVVRQDEDGRWKILGWYEIESDAGDKTDDDDE